MNLEVGINPVYQIEMFYNLQFMLIIRCSKCKGKLFKYKKIGRGRVLKCFKDRIVKQNYLIRDGTVFCRCGNIIGSDMGDFIKMRQSSFTYSGTFSNESS